MKVDIRTSCQSLLCKVDESKDPDGAQKSSETPNTWSTQCQELLPGTYHFLGRGRNMTHWKRVKMKEKNGQVCITGLTMPSIFLFADFKLITRLVLSILSIWPILESSSKHLLDCSLPHIVQSSLQSEGCRSGAPCVSVALRGNVCSCSETFLPVTPESGQPWACRRSFRPPGMSGIYV